MDRQILVENKKVNDLYTGLISWDWLHGTTPKFSNSIETKFPWGLVDFNCDVENSKIVRA